MSHKNFYDAMKNSVMVSGALHVGDPVYVDTAAYKMQKYKDLKEELAELEEVLRAEGLLEDELV